MWKERGTSNPNFLMLCYGRKFWKKRRCGDELGEWRVNGRRVESEESGEWGMENEKGFKLKKDNKILRERNLNL